VTYRIEPFDPSDVPPEGLDVAGDGAEEGDVVEDELYELE
jgi:hypothetical protein